MSKRESDKELAKEIGQRIRSARFLAGLKQKDLARKTGLSSTTISLYEKGRSIPGMRSISKISKALHASIDWMLGGEHPHSRARRVVVDGIEYVLTPVRKNNGLDRTPSGD